MKTVIKAIKKVLKATAYLLILSVFAGILTWFFAPQYLKQVPLVKDLNLPSADEMLSGKHNKSHKESTKESVIEHAKKHSDPNYVCPMHPQIVKGEPGNCPICGMDLVEKELDDEEEESEQEVTSKQETVLEHAKKHSDPNYVCPMHPQIIKGEPGNCPICGMDLVAKEPIEDDSSDEGMADVDKSGEKSGEKKILYWVAPMDANYRRDKPGKSLMGMDLVPVYDEGQSKDSDSGLPRIKVKASTAQKMGIRTETVTRKKLSRIIHTVGSIGYNEDSLHHIHSRTNGWVEKVYVKAEGEKVKKGHPLVEFYSPDIVAAQKDLIIAKTSGKLFSQKGSASLVGSAKQKLRLLDVPESIIKRVQTSGKSQDRVPILAPENGVIIDMGIRDGMYVTPMLEMYSIADLSTVWVQVDVYEHQLSWMSVGNTADIEVRAIPGKVWTGKIDYIYPELNPVTRTLRVRLKFETPEQLLRPNMFADVTLYSKAKSALSVPAEAMIYYENSPRVVKVVSKNKYKPVEVKTGMKSDGQVEILEGLKEGDKIVVSGQFLLDSESNLQASFRRMMDAN